MGNLCNRKRPISIFRDRSYTIDKYSSSSLILKGKNAYVHLVLKNEHWTNNDFDTLVEPFDSEFRIAGIYAKHNKYKPRSPRGYTRKMLCYAIEMLLVLGHPGITGSSVVAIEVDESVENRLVKKVYEPMGFAMMSISSSSDSGGIMKTTVSKIIEWGMREYST